MRLLGAVKRGLIASERWHRVLIVVLAFVMFVPALFAGFAIDDHVFRALFQDLPGIDGLTFNPLDTFLFGDGIPEHTLARIEKGFAPWWSPPDWKVGFWRPLSSWSHWVDFQIWGDRAFMMHAESIALYALIGLILYRLYRTTLAPVWVAAMAVLLYLVDDGHAVPVSWISNRNTVLSTLFAALTLLFHDRWRREGARWGLPAALASLAIGLLSGEATLAVGGYLFAHALFLDRGGYAMRIVRLLPYLAVVVVWRVVYTHLGYGISKAGIYTDPGAQPLQFLVDVVLFVPLLLLSQFAQPDPMGVWMFAPAAGQAAFWLAAAAFVAVLAWVMWPVLRERPEARFWALGMMLSLVPACATMPQARLLMVPSIGAMALVALLFARWLEGVDRRRMTTVLVYAFAMLHLVLAPIMTWGTPAGMQAMESAFRKSNASLDAIPDLNEKHLVVLSTISDLNAVGIPLMRSAFSVPVPGRTTVLYTGLDELHVSRPDAKSLVVRPEGGFLPRPWGQIFVDPREVRYTPGDRVDLGTLAAEILEVLPDGRPAVVRFEFDAPLESSDFAFVRWEDGRYVEAGLPAVGEAMVVSGMTLVELMRGVV